MSKQFTQIIVRFQTVIQSISSGGFVIAVNFFILPISEMATEAGVSIYRYKMWSGAGSQ